jgi:hypothetical protein
MAAIPLTPGTPIKHTIGANYTAFTVEYGRNIVVTCKQNFYYHPSLKDNVAVDASEQFEFLAGTYSIRLPGSGAGRDSVDDDNVNAFSLAAVSGSHDIWVLPVVENI